MSQTYYFLHIPKTAGTSLMRWLADTGQFNICPDGLWSLLMKRDKAQLEEYSMFCGHFYRYLSLYLGKPLSTFTFLRNPFDRALSHYEHIRQDRNHFFYDKVQTQGSFLAFIKDPETRPLINNFQTRALSGIFDPVKVASSIKCSPGEKFPLEKFLTTFIDTGLDDHTSLLLAKDFLTRCIFVGISEHPQESTEKLAKILGVQTAPQIGHFNENPSRRTVDSLSKDEWVALAELLCTDIELYEFGQELLFRRR